MMIKLHDIVKINLNKAESYIVYCDGLNLFKVVEEDNFDPSRGLLDIKCLKTGEVIGIFAARLEKVELDTNDIRLILYVDNNDV